MHLDKWLNHKRFRNFTGFSLFKLLYYSLTLITVIVYVNALDKIGRRESRTKLQTLSNHQNPEEFPTSARTAMPAVE